VGNIVYHKKGVGRINCPLVEQRVRQIVSTAAAQRVGFRKWMILMRQVNNALVAFALMASGIEAAELPNILWITCEDMGPQLGCYGDDYARTPNLDALPAQGMRYTNAISNAPVCAPARTTIISGLYPPSTGAEHMRSMTRLPAGFRMYPQFLRDAGCYATNNSKEDYNLAKPGRVWDESSPTAHWKNCASGQPFFAVFNHTITHESQIRSEIDERDRIHNPAGVRVPAYHPDTPEVRRDWAQYYDRITMMDAEIAANLQELENAGLADDTIVFFYSDHGSGMPRNKRSACNSGLHVPMIVHFPPRWRRLAPKNYQPGGTSDRLVSFIDLAPTVLSLAGIEPPKWMQGGAFAGKYETAEPEFSYGFRGRMDERYDLVRSVRDKRYMYVRNFMPHRPAGQHCAYMFETSTTRVWRDLFQKGKLNADQARFWQTKPAEELYDLATDPDEVHNLCNSTEHQEVLSRLRTAQREWASRIRDIGLLSEWEMHERSENSTPYEMGHDPQRYDFDSVFAAAELASSLDPADLPKVAKLLKDDDSAVRYWAAIGILAHQDAGMRLAHDDLVAALADRSPMVRITAAEALGRFGDQADVAEALEVLVRFARPDANAYLGIVAWNALDYLDDRARPVMQTLNGFSPEPADAPQRVSGYGTRLKQATLAGLGLDPAAR